MISVPLTIEGWRAARDAISGYRPTRPFAGLALSSKSADENFDDPPRRSAPGQRYAALKTFENFS
jgi:hypothetical protein